MQAEIANLRAERDELLVQKAVLADRETNLRNEVEALKDNIIKTQQLLIDLFSNKKNNSIMEE